MFQTLIVLHILLAVSLVGVVLIQRSEGGGLGIGSSGGMGGFMTARGTANLLTRITAGLFAAFVVTSMLLAVISGSGRQPSSIVDQMPAAPSSSPAAPPAPAAPAPPVR